MLQTDPTEVDHPLEAQKHTVFIHTDPVVRTSSIAREYHNTDYKDPVTALQIHLHPSGVVQDHFTHPILKELLHRIQVHLRQGK